MFYISGNRLNGDIFELAKFFIDKETRNLGIATRLIERCLWLQTIMHIQEAHKLKTGFHDKQAPGQLNRAEK